MRKLSMLTSTAIAMVRELQISTVVFAAPSQRFVLLLADAKAAGYACR